jgi:Zn-finger protein
MILEPKNLTDNKAFMFFQNKDCPFWMCHKGVSPENFSCLFCYCPLIWLECKGPYTVFTDKHGLKRKDCSSCFIVHNGKIKSWKFIQKAIEKPIIWRGQSQNTRILDRFMRDFS